MTTFHGEIPQNRKNKIVLLKFWGNSAGNLKNYYQTNDYVLIEGYITTKNKRKSSLSIKSSKSIFITVLKIYPFLLKSNRTFKKL